jgi:hypothetical protein
MADRVSYATTCGDILQEQEGSNSARCADSLEAETWSGYRRVLSENSIRLWIRILRQNRRIINGNVCDSLCAWNVSRRPIQVAQPA